MSEAKVGKVLYNYKHSAYLFWQLPKTFDLGTEYKIVIKSHHEHYKPRAVEPQAHLAALSFSWSHQGTEGSLGSRGPTCCWGTRRGESRGWWRVWWLSKTPAPLEKLTHSKRLKWRNNNINRKKLYFTLCFYSKQNKWELLIDFFGIQLAYHKLTQGDETK